MHTAPQSIGEAMVARALARRRRFAGIDTPATPAIAEAVAHLSTPERMAEHMREIEAAAGAVTEDLLALKGWSLSEIAEHGADAARLASLASEGRA